MKYLECTASIHCWPAQIGILLCGVTIDNMIIGGPAYNSRQLEIGDIILQVDGVAATLASFLLNCPRFQDQTRSDSMLAGEHIGAPNRKRCPWKQCNPARSKGRPAGSMCRERADTSKWEAFGET